MIGAATSTKPNAEGIVGTNTQTLMPGSEVYENETVRTGSRGVADLVFVDRTNLSVGPASEVHLDKFVYDPVGSNGAVVFNATRGAFRFITGSQDHRIYRVGTPYGTLGVRGTTVEGVIQPNIIGKALPKEACIAKFRLSEGAGLTFTKPNGETYTLTEIGSCVCVHPDGTVTTETSCPSIYAVSAAAPAPPPPPTGSGGGCVETPTMSCPTR